MHIKPTLTSDKIGSYQVENGYISLNDCTDLNKENCYRKAGGNVIINPVRSARLNTKDTFSFKYGRVEVIAKAPLGDWLWPGKDKFGFIHLIKKNRLCQRDCINSHRTF